MYKVMVCEDTRENALGDTYQLSEYPTREEAFREARAGRMAYPNGNAWVENELGEVVPDPTKKEALTEEDNIQNKAENNLALQKKLSKWR